MHNTPELSSLSPMEKTCLEFIQLVRRMGAAPPGSKEGIVILRKIKELQARAPQLQRVGVGGPAVIGSISASAEDFPPVLPKRFRPTISWKGVTIEARFLWAA